jgi:hypothetical protein
VAAVYHRKVLPGDAVAVKGTAVLPAINRRIDNGGATAISAFKSIRLNHINQKRNINFYGIKKY